MQGCGIDVLSYSKGEKATSSPCVDTLQEAQILVIDFRNVPFDLAMQYRLIQDVYVRSHHHLPLRPGTCSLLQSVTFCLCGSVGAPRVARHFY